MTRLLVIGGSGFVGRHLLPHLKRTKDLQVRWAIHDTPLPAAVPSAHDVCRVDLGRATDLAGIVAGADAVLNLGHRISGNVDELTAVNDDGVARLVRACRAQQVSRVVQLSTAAVYGPGPWPAVPLEDLRPDPRSPVSTTRLAGDAHVLAYGGDVVRPHLVHGRGDQWFVPRALQLLARVGWVDGGRARHSLVSADRLAGLLLRVATTPQAQSVHTPDVSPRSIRSFLTAQCRRRGLAVPVTASTLDEALAHPAAVGDRRWAHDVRLMATDHLLLARSSA